LALLRTDARFPGLDQRAAHYESFYLKATRPGGGQGVWIRHTVHKRPGAELEGSLWFTFFDAESAGPRATKVTVDASQVSGGGDAYIEVGGTVFADGLARGEARTGELEASWDLRFEPGSPAFRHLPYSFLYSAPLPKTKLLSPYPNTRFSGTVTLDGEELAVDAWPGMVGHNWGSEHAERWIWMEANEFRESDGWFDAGLGRIKIGPLTTPWIGNAMLCLDGVEHRLGGLDRIRSTRVEEEPTECEFELTGKDIKVRGRVAGEPRNFVAWVYADPVGPEHNALNCSISDLELTVERKGEPARRLECIGAAAYELGTRDTDHGIQLQPYADG
jgi:hypothetical protein